MLAIKRSTGVEPEVNQRNRLHAAEEAGIHPEFETQGRHHQKSKTGISVVPQKGHFITSSKFFFKNVHLSRQGKQNLPICFKCSQREFTSNTGEILKFYKLKDGRELWSGMWLQSFDF